MGSNSPLLIRNNRSKTTVLINSNFQSNESARDNSNSPLLNSATTGRKSMLYSSWSPLNRSKRKMLCVRIYNERVSMPTTKSINWKILLPRNGLISLKGVYNKFQGTRRVID